MGMNTCGIIINKLKKCTYGTEGTDWKGQEDKLDFAKICSLVGLTLALCNFCTFFVATN